jgi:predicted small lipoprotein YifL
VKVSGIVVLAILVLLVVAAIATGGQHGPMRHMPSGAPVGPAGSGGPPAALQAQQHDRA